MNEKERSARRRQTESYREYQRDYQRAYYHRTKEKVAAYRATPERQAYMKNYRDERATELTTRRRENARLLLYGLTSERFQEMLEAQDWQCAICSRMLTDPVVDHFHGTKTVRGILCRRCNAGLGMFDENTDSLERAIEYLTRSWSGATSTTNSAS